MSMSPTGPDQAAHSKHRYGWIDDLNLKATIAQVLDRWPCAGLAVAVVADGNIVWFHGHGLADVAAKTPITEDTVFRIGSVTKTFTAVAVMQLWEQGLLGCGGFVRHRLLASSDTAGHVSVPRMLVCVDTASAPDGCQVVRCFVAWARR